MAQKHYISHIMNSRMHLPVENRRNSYL